MSLNESTDDIRAQLDNLLEQQKQDVDPAEAEVKTSTASDAAPAPIPEEEPDQEEEVEPKDEEVCTVCHTSNNAKTWIQCDNIKCQAWVHVECDRMTDEMLVMFEDDKSRYYCPTCRRKKRVPHPEKRWNEIMRKNTTTTKRKARAPARTPTKRSNRPKAELVPPDPVVLRATRSSGVLGDGAPAWIEEAGIAEDGSVQFALPPMLNAKHSLEPLFEKMIPKFTTVNHTQVFVSYKGAVTKNGKEHIRIAQLDLDDLYKQFYQHMIDFRDNLVDQMYSRAHDVLEHALEAQITDCGKELTTTYPERRVPETADIAGQMVSELVVMPPIEEWGVDEDAE
ncbi:PHD-finger [Carpediemonas membranifera]|uniref:PHD-finger n=1 Tax=Carpediemonas membranifera TaxID=201153 RepID=A0A8J6B3H9_9EUKA|nr:PHD-finger [Carpediemonas membranifera]|eukprot:KAG9394938.1 PHD-finger [Carpediemonas membranifera]